MKEPTILDANLERLLRRAYVPALPSPGFRDRLLATFLAEQARRSEREAPRVLRPLRRRAAWIAAAALVVVASLVALRFLGDRDAGPDLAEIHAAGHVAVRSGPEAAWRSVEGSFEHELPWLEVATPSHGSLDVHLREGALVTAGPETRVVLEEHPDGQAFRLAYGELDLWRDAADTRWVVATSHGTVEVGPARLALTDERAAVRLHLGEGRAWIPAASGPEDVPVGREVRLVHGRLLVPDDPAGPNPPPSPGAGRVAVDPPPADADPGSGEDGPTTATVRGRVGVDGEEEPVTSFVVAVLRERLENSYYQPDLHEVESPDGTFEVTGIRPGRYEIFVHAPGLALWRSSLRSLARGETVALEASLGQGGDVRGVVVDPITGTPVAGASLLSGRDAVSVGVPFDLDRYPVWLPASTRSAPGGSFALSHLTPGEHALRITAPGYAPQWTEPFLVEEGSSRILEPIKLRTGAAVEGTVTAADGTPAPDHRLIITRLGVSGESGMDFGMAITDLQGHFRVEDLPPGMLLAILLLDEDGSEAPLVKPFACSPDTTARLDFRIEPPGTRVHGVLRGAAGGPVASRNLALVPADLDTQGRDTEFVATATNDAGEYAFEGVSPGRYVFLAIMDQTGDELLLLDDIDVPNAPEVAHDIWLWTGRIAGRVTDAATDAPLGPCMVSLVRFFPDGDRSFAGQTRADDEGRYAFPDVPQGTYRVVATPLGPPLGFETGGELVLDDATPARTCDLALEPGGSARITVRDTRGRPLPGVVLVFHLGDGSPFVRDAYFATNAEGTFVLEGLRPGTYRVRGELHGYRKAEQEFPCRVTLETRVEITLHEEE